MKRRASIAARDGDLFAAPRETVADELDQHFTAAWAAELIVQRRFAFLRPGHRVLEPTAGSGAFLCALPPGVQGIGVEIDPQLAEAAERNSGHPVVVGDIRTVDLPDRVDAVIGNPPFDIKLFETILDRIHPLLPTGGKAGFLLPSYFFQTEKNVLTYNRHWSMMVENVPRRLWPGLSKTVVYAEFTRDTRHELVGFFLYGELASFRALSARYQDDMRRPSRSLWLNVVTRAITELGGEASLPAIYRAIEGKEPTPNPFWREQVRKVVRQSLTPTMRGNYRLPNAKPLLEVSSVA